MKLINITFVFITYCLPMKLILDISFKILAINATPGIDVIVVMTKISPKNILYISSFFTPIALSIPTSFILDKKEALIIKNISTKDIANKIPAMIREFLILF